MATNKQSNTPLLDISKIQKNRPESSKHSGKPPRIEPNPQTKLDWLLKFAGQLGVSQKASQLQSIYNLPFITESDNYLIRIKQKDNQYYTTKSRNISIVANDLQNKINKQQIPRQQSEKGRTENSYQEDDSFSNKGYSIQTKQQQQQQKIDMTTQIITKTLQPSNPDIINSRNRANNYAKLQIKETLKHNLFYSSNNNDDYSNSQQSQYEISNNNTNMSRQSSNNSRTVPSRNSSHNSKRILQDITNTQNQQQSLNSNQQQIQIDGNKKNKENIDSYNANKNQVKPNEVPPQVTARCWALFDAKTQKFIDGKSPYNVREIASLTKITTLYTTLKLFSDKENIDYSQIQFKVSRYATTMSGTTANLQEGMWISLKDLFYGLMLPSGNDASIVIAENVGALIYLLKGSNTELLSEILYKRDTLRSFIQKQRYPIISFITEMNRNARELLMTQTNYSNPHGLMHRDNKSSAYDVGKMCCAAIQYKMFLEVVNTKFYTANVEHNDNTITLEWENTNKLLYKPDQGWYGIKTGITDTAGPCLASSIKMYDNVKRCQKEFIIVILNSKTMDTRWEESQKIANWAKNHWEKSQAQKF